MESLRKLPKVDELLKNSEVQALVDNYSRDLVLDHIRASISEIREKILRGEEISPLISFEEEIIKNIEIKLKKKTERKLKRVINGTGIVIHTNLGRSLLCEEAVEGIKEVAESYSNLEYSLEDGKRGKREENIKDYLLDLTGAEDVIVVNNNAAAVMLVLSSLCKGKEVIISRGELVEIGGSFRIPDIMELSGAYLKEVGTTNRTHLKDYEWAISENTGAFLKVHSSNYKILGFTKEVDAIELKPLSEKYNIPLIEDLGSGLIVPLEINEDYKEHTVKERIKSGIDVITFSGDKLLGGPQCGIIAGKKEYIEIIKKNQLNRALRVDKFTLVALELTLKQYIIQRAENIPTIKMLRKSKEEIRDNLNILLEGLSDLGEEWDIKLEEDKTFVGGGALPLMEVLTYVLAIKNKKVTEVELEKYLREYTIPIICRLNKGRLILDGRCLLEKDFKDIISALKDFGGKK